MEYNIDAERSKYTNREPGAVDVAMGVADNADQHGRARIRSEGVGSGEAGGASLWVPRA
jgi:hypothetical protein